MIQSSCCNLLQITFKFKKQRERNDKTMAKPGASEKRTIHQRARQALPQSKKEERKKCELKTTRPK
jgi:hypothetical protein